MKKFEVKHHPDVAGKPAYIIVRREDNHCYAFRRDLESAQRVMAKLEES